MKKDKIPEEELCNPNKCGNYKDAECPSTYGRCIMLPHNNEDE